MSENGKAELEELRDEIDSIDEEIIEKIVERVGVAEDVAKVKREADLDLVQKGREKEVKSNYGDHFADNGFPPEKGEKIAEVLIATSLTQEADIK